LFEKPYTTPAGVATQFHALLAVELRFVPTMPATVVASVSSYPNESDYMLGRAPAWVTPVSVPESAIGANVGNSVQTWLITDASSPFVGGVKTKDPSTDPLEQARDRQLALLKASRRVAVAGVDMDANQATITAAVKAIRDKFTTLQATLAAAADVQAIQAVVW